MEVIEKTAQNNLNDRINSFFFEPQKWAEIHLARYAPRITKPGPQHWLQELEASYGGKLYGGYLENRAPLFDARHDAQALIHLGIDFWVPAETLVRLPFAGEILSATPAKDESYGGWGGRVDVLAEGRVWIFGHLKNPIWRTGDKLSPDSLLGSLGTREENGGWLPHLHLQCATLGEYERFPNPRDMDAYAAPRPNLATDYPNPLFL